MIGHDLGNIGSIPIYWGVQQVSFPPIFLSRENKTVRIETHSLLFGGNLETDKKLLDFFNVPTAYQLWTVMTVHFLMSFFGDW
jgi:hypothetical protein